VFFLSRIKEIELTH